MENPRVYILLTFLLLLKVEFLDGKLTIEIMSVLALAVPFLMCRLNNSIVAQF